MSARNIAWALFAFAAAVRCIYIFAVSDHAAVQFPLGDSLAYHRAALRILGGDWIGSEVFYQDPLYPYLLAALYGLFGVGSVGVLFVQALIDSFSVMVIYWIARELFDARTAWIAAAFTALYRVSWFYDALLLKVPLTLLLAALTALFLLRAQRAATVKAWFMAAFALGMAALTRGNYLVFVPVLFAWVLVWGGGARRDRARMAAAIALGLGVAIGPVTLRNYLVADDLVLITSQAGQNFYIGNHRDNASGVYKAPRFVVANAAHEQDDFRSEAERRTGAKMKPSELSRFWFAEAFREIAVDPGHFARHTFRKFRLFFNYYEIPDNQSFAFFAEHVTWMLSIPTPSYGVLVPLALAGLGFARRQRCAWLLALLFASYAASVILFFNVSRYRIPALPAIFVFAGFGVSELFDKIVRRELKQVAAIAVALATGFWFTHLNLIDEDFAMFRSNLGTALSRRAVEHHLLAHEAAITGDAVLEQRERSTAAGLWEAAEQEFRKGLDIRRRDPRLRAALKSLLSSRIERSRAAGRFDEALEFAERMAASFPRDAEGLAAEGEIHEARGDLVRAERALMRALSVSPGHRRARQGLARVRAAQRANP